MNERKNYNQKLLKEGLKDEIKGPHKIDWIEFITNCIGCFLGLILNDAIGIETLIHNTVGNLIVRVLIITVSIIIVHAVVYALKKIIKLLYYKKSV